MQLMPKAVLFDWDNTILDNKSQIVNAVKKTFSSMDMDESHYTFYSGPRIQYLKRNFGENWQKAEEFLNKHLEDIFINELFLFEGVEKVLEFLKSKNVYTAVVSNKLSVALNEEVHHFKLDKFFNKIVGSGDTAFDKPSKIPLLFALEGSGIIPSKQDVFFIGDSIVDMECAYNADVTGIVYNNYIEDYTQNRKIHNFDELLNFFHTLK